LSNSIFANVGLGIDLADDGVTLNTPGGPHVGPNEFQNFPEIEAATVAGSSTTIQVSLNSIPNTPFIIQVFANPAKDPTGYGQGRTLVATATPLVLFTDPTTGFGNIVFTVPQDLTGQYLTATATALGTYFETSEFGKDFEVTVPMAIAPPGQRGATAATGNLLLSTQLAPPAQNLEPDMGGIAAVPTNTSRTPLQTIPAPGLDGATGVASGHWPSGTGLVSSGSRQGQPQWSETAVPAGIAATDVLDRFFAGSE
jgi:hypothetical protein